MNQRSNVFQQGYGPDSLGQAYQPAGNQQQDKRANFEEFIEKVIIAYLNEIKVSLTKLMSN